MPEPTAATGSSVIGAVRYRDAHQAITWLQTAFGFTLKDLFAGPDNTVAHAQLVYGPGMIMVSSTPESLGHAGSDYAKTMAQPDECGNRSTVAMCLIVPNATAAYNKAVAAGARIFAPLEEMSYGGKAFGCFDSEGHVWNLGEYNPWA